MADSYFDIRGESRFIRDLLKKKLKSLGFGMWQRSIYISPFNVAFFPLGF